MFKKSAYKNIILRSRPSFIFPPRRIVLYNTPCSKVRFKIEVKITAELTLKD